MTGLSAIDHGAVGYRGEASGRASAPASRMVRFKLTIRLYFTHWDAAIPTEKRDASSLADLARETLDEGLDGSEVYAAAGRRGNGSGSRKMVAELAALSAKYSARQCDIALECAETFTVRSAIQFASADRAVCPHVSGRAAWRENPAGSRGSRGEESGPDRDRRRIVFALRIQAITRCERARRSCSRM